MGKQVAILIDGDNISSKYAEHIKQEAMNYGNVKVYRLYGSITSPSVKSWYKIMPLQGIMPVLQISYANGKSIADQALTIDAMDLLYTNDIDVFCIVSSDCDFTKLVYRLKEAGKYVIGMGEKKAKEALAKACDEFKILDLIYKDASIAEFMEEEEVLEESAIAGKGEVTSEDEELSLKEDIEESEISIPAETEIVDCINDYMDSSDDEKINLAEIGNILNRKYLGFDARNYGYKNIKKMVESHKDKFTLITKKAQDGIHVIIYISSKKSKN